MFIIAAELYGGLAEGSDKLLRGWAREFAPQGAGHSRASDALLRAWRMEMSIGLLEARVGAAYAAMAKLRSEGLKKAGVEAGGVEKQLRVYEIVERRSVMAEFAEQARAARGFMRSLGR